jgi:hypothetical protein
MSFVSHSTDPNIMTSDQLNQLKENYVNFIIDGMDIDSLVQYASEQLIEYFKDFDEDELKAEIVDLCGDDILSDLLVS